MSISPANPRAAAAAMLAAVLRRRRPLDEVLAEAFGPTRSLGAAAARDRAFARLLVGTVLRRLGAIDALLAGCLDKPLAADAAAERDLLRLGAAQLIFLGTPPHAAVDGSVRLVRPASRYRGLVNAVLRRLASEGTAMLQALDLDRLDTPAWLWESWCATYGEAAARRIAAAHRQEAPLDITAPREAERWAAALEADVLPTGTLRRSGGGAIELLPGFAEGAWWVQDCAAALPARLLGPVDGKAVIDLCAAPGGKTAQLAAAGAKVTDVERSPARLQRLAENLARLKLHATTVAADAAAWQPAEPADAVLLDAPCGATGTIRRHPDVAWLKQPDDVASLMETQDRLVAAAARMVRPGGCLIYCVCSLQLEEGPQRIDRLLTAGAAFVRQPIAAAEVGGLAELVTADGDLRTLPCHLAERGGMDGFYACRLIRQE